MPYYNDDSARRCPQCGGTFHAVRRTGYGEARRLDCGCTVDVIETDTDADATENFQADADNNGKPPVEELAEEAVMNGTAKAVTPLNQIVDDEGDRV